MAKTECDLAEVVHYDAATDETRFAMAVFGFKGETSEFLHEGVPVTRHPSEVAAAASNLATRSAAEISGQYE
jgi:hypothetical protein